MYIPSINSFRLSIVAILIFPIGIKGQGYFDYNQDIACAYRYVLQLKTDSARLMLQKIERDQPYNLARYHIENYIDFFTVFLGEDTDDLKSFNERKKNRLSLIKAQKLESPYWRFAQAEISLQYALARIKFGEYIRAGWDINRANKLLTDNQKLYPDFILNNKSLSIIHALMGSLRGIRKSLITMFTSLSGSYIQGIKEIDQLFQSADAQQGIFGYEIRAIRALISAHVEKTPTAALSIIDIDSIKRFKSPLIDFVRYTIAKQNQNTQLDLVPYLDSAIAHRGDTPFDYLNLLMGIELLQKGDKRAKDYLLTFVNEFQGRHYVKYAYQKLAWYDLIINRDEKAYLEWMQKLLEVGHTSIGEDQLAEQEALSARIPNSSLLHARLLYDGGNYSEALSVLTELQLYDIDERQHLEYYYRKARCLQGLKNDQGALTLYKQVIAIGADQPSYYACSSALQSGIMLYGLGYVEQALNMLALCLSLKPKEHRESLHQKAKSWQLKIRESLSNK